MDYKVTIQAIDYLANRCSEDGKMNKISTLKLLYFAERYHMRKYARMITDDTYFAMQYGPVASGARNVLYFDDIDTDNAYASEILKNIDSNFFISNQKLSSFEYDYLSDTDKEALDFAVDTFGSFSKWQLVEETHKYPEWKKFEKLFEHSSTKRENVDIDDFFSDLISEDDPYKAIPMENVKLSQELFHTGF